MSGSDPLDPTPSHADPLVVGVATRLAPGLQRVLAPNPGPMTGPGTNTYVLGTDDVTVIDPGPDDPAHVAAILEATAGRIDRIVCTHTHLDHWPAAEDLRRATGCAVLAVGSRDGLSVTDTLDDGDVVVTGEYRIEIIHTPGHASNHLCGFLPDTGMLFTGDHVMQGSTVVISPPDGDMSAYLRSLERVRNLEGLRTIAPAHGHLIHDPVAVIDALVAHRLQREAIVAAVLADHPDGATVDTMVPVVYADVDPMLYPLARRSLWAHLRKLADDARATSADRNDVDTAAWFPTDTTRP